VTKALLVLLVFGGAAAVCFWRAYTVQAKWAVDGIVKGQVRSRLYLWVIAGTTFLTFALIFSFAAIEPAILGGKR
jgi:hypothetical protein